MHEQAGAQLALQSRQRLLGFADVGGRQQQDELFAAEARQVVNRAQRRAHARGQRDQGFVADAVAERVVELLEIVDVDQRHRQRGAVARVARALGIEGLGQAAPVGHLGQRVDRDLFREPPQFAFEFAHPRRELHRFGLAGLQARTGAGHLGLHRAAVLHHLAHQLGQTVLRVGVFEVLGIAAELLAKAAGLAAQIAEFGHQALHQRLQRVAGAVALALQTLLLLPRLCQQVLGGAHAAHAQRRAAVDRAQARLHRLGLAAGPALVFGQLGQAGREFTRQRGELLDQLVALPEQAPRLQAGLLDLGHQRHSRAFEVDAPRQRGELVGQFAGTRFVARQCRLHRAVQAGHQHAPARVVGAGRPHRARRGGRWHLLGKFAGLGLRARVVAVGVPTGGQLAQPVMQALRVGAAAVEHALQAIFLACRGPVAAAALDAAHHALDQRRPLLCRDRRGGRRCGGATAFLGPGAGVVFRRRLELRAGQPA